MESTKEFYARGAREIGERHRAIEERHRLRMQQADAWHYRCCEGCWGRGVLGGHPCRRCDETGRIPVAAPSGLGSAGLLRLGEGVRWDLGG